MIIKRRVTRFFVQLDNALVRDRRLSLDEHGMLHYLLSLPDDWEVNQTQCAKFWGIGRDRCRRIFVSLRRTGWAQLERLQNDEGVFIGARWIIGDEPGPEATDEALAAEQADDEEGLPETPTETTAAPESKAPDALASGDHATPKPHDGQAVARVNHATEKASDGRIKTLEEEKDSTNTTGHAFRADDDDGEPPPRFGELLRLWPSDNVASAYACERVFVKFSDKQKRQARDGMRPYLDDCRHKGHNRLCDLRTYLDERRFEKFVMRTVGSRLFLVKRATPEAERWREYLKEKAPGKLAVFQIALAGAGYTAPSQWPPPMGPSTGQAREEPATGPPTQPESLMSEEDEEIDIPIK